MFEESFQKKYEMVRRFAAEAHGDQKRKYLGTPYIQHPESVARIVKIYGGDSSMILASLLHDVIEDTDVTRDQLQDFLKGENFENRGEILALVDNLTDVYTKENFPELNRKERKKLEAERLGNIHPRAQTIKLADLYDNTISIVNHDKKFAKIYLQEKSEILKHMNKGHFPLYVRVCHILYCSSWILSSRIIDKSYNSDLTWNANLFNNVRWESDDEKDDLHFYIKTFLPMIMLEEDELLNFTETE